MQGKKRQWLTGVAAGTIVIAMGVRVSAATSTITVTGAVLGGVNAQFSGTTSIVVNVTKTGSVSNTSGPAIIAGAQSGSATVVDNGVVSSTGGDGIDATSNSATGVASITINKSLTATGDGALAQNNASGLATVAIGSGTAANPVTITSAATDAVAIGVNGAGQVTVGNHDVFIAGAAGVAGNADVSAIGVFTPTNAGGPISTTVGTNDSFTLLGNNGAAITAHTGVPGFGPNGTASASVSVGNGVAIQVSGYSNAGVIAFVADPTPANAYSGTGNASVVVGSGSITVDEVGAAGAPAGAMTNVGVAALSGGGAVSIDNAAVVTVTGGLDASVGLGTKTTGSGTSLITSRASVTSNNGDGIKAVTAGGANTVNVVGGAVVATGGDGIDAIASGGTITVATSAGTDVKTTTPGALSGILASDTTGNIVIVTKGTVSNGGILATTGGSGSITIQASGAVNDSNGAGISATAANGPVSITTGAGAVTATGTGVFGESTGAGGVAITVGPGGVQTTGVAAVEALDLQGGPGAASVTTLNGATKAPLAISGAQVGVEAITVAGPAAVTIGNQNSFTVGASGATKVAGAVALDLFGLSDLVPGVPSAKVTVGANDSFTVQGNNGAAISAQIGQAGLSGPAGGSGSVVATVGNGIAIHVSGLSDAGVIGFVSDPSGGNLYAGTGNVSLTVGTGSIVVDEVGASGPLAGAKIDVGVAALSSGGNVMVDDAATVTASGGQDVSRGLSAITSGAGTSLVIARASVTSLNGDGIFSSTQNGQNTVNVLGGVVSSTGGDGIDAVASGAGGVTVTTAAKTDVNGTVHGILAQSGSGAVTVTAAGTVSAGGVDAVTGGGGGVTVTTASVTNAAGVGVSAMAGSGPVSVTTNGAITASGDGVFAQSLGSSVSVAVGGNVTSGGGFAVEAFAFDGSPGSITTSSGASKSNPLTISSAGNGLAALSLLGKASVQVGNNVSVTAGAGAAVVSVAVLTSADAGGPASSVVTGTNDVFNLNANDGAAISAQLGLGGGVAGNPGLPNGTASSLVNVGNGVAINVSGLDDAGVIGSVIDLSGKNAFAGSGNVSVTVGTGAINVNETGAIGTADGMQTNVGVGALSGGGSVSIDDASVATVSGGQDRSIGLDAITSGLGTSLVNARVSVTSLNGDGIFSSTQNGQNTVNVLGGAISSTGGDGIDAVASGGGGVMVTTAVGTTVGTTTPGAFSGILASSALGPVTVTAAGTVGDGGISATSGAGGAVTVSAAKVTNSAGIGVSATSGSGPVSVTTNGAITASGDGVFAQSQGSSVTVAVGGNVTSGGMFAVEAFAFDGASGSVTTASGASKSNPLTISSASNGLAALSLLGKASLQVGNNVSVTAGGGAAVGAAAVLTSADAGGPASSVVTGANDVFTLQANDGAAVDASVGFAGGVAFNPELPNGTASALVNVGNGVTINVSGLDDAGVIGFVTDVSGKNAYATSGNVSVTVGTGAINVNETGAIGTADGMKTNVGVGAFSAGGAVSIDDAAVVTVSGGQDASIGLEAVTTGLGASTVTSRANITSLNGDGIRSATATGANQVTVLAGKVSGSVYGVEAISTGIAAVTINTAAGTDVRTTTPAVGNFGILGQSSGTVTINAAGTVSEGGISASGGGDALVTQAGAVTSTVADGIDVNSFGGAADIFSTARITAAGDGVLADGFTALVSASAPITAGADFADIDAIGDASASIVTGNGTSAARLVFKSGGTGIAGTAFGDPGAVQIQIGDFNTVTAGGNTQTHNDGVLAESLGITDNGPIASANIVLGASDTVTVKGNDAGGVAAVNFSFSGMASASVLTGDGVNVHVSGFDVQGIAAATTLPALAAQIDSPLPGGNTNVTVGAGTVTVDESGAAGFANGNFGNENVGVASISGGGNATLDDSAVVTASGGADVSVGLQAETTGSGTVLVNARANVTSHQGDGIEAFAGTGSDTVNVYAAVSATAAAVAAVGSGAVTVNVTPGASISGHAVGIKAASTAGPVTVSNAGTITSSAGPGVALVSGGAITLDNASTGIIGGAGSSSAINVTGGGTVSIDNLGQIGTNISNLSLSSVGSGPLTLTNELSGLFEGRLTGGDNVTFNNAGVWQTRGTSDFGTAANAATNTLNNVGTVVVGFTGPTTSASSASFLDLGTFNNGSATGSGTVSMANGKVGDKLTVSGLFNGGAGGSNLNLDAFLGGPGSKADQLILQGGSAGLTLITIDDTNTGLGALNSKGIVLVTGATSGATFALNPTQPGYDVGQGGIVKGLFLYPLVFNAGTEELVGLPGAPAMEMATMASAAEQVWSSTTPGDESAAGLRLSLAGGGDAGPDGPHLWAKAVNGGPSRLNRGDTLMGRANFASDPSAGGTGDVGAPMVGTMQQTQTETAFGMTYGFNTGYSQNVSALLTGVDLAHHVGQSEAWSWGISSGYLESQQSFTAGAALASYSGALAAVHGAYVNTNGFYVAGDAKLTALQVDYATNWAGAGHPTTSITTFGGEADAGWRRSLSAHWTLEPSASISMQSSKLGSLNVDGTDVKFGDANSVRLGFGGKLDGSWRIAGYSLKSESSLRVWDELEGANTLLLGGSGDGFTLPDQIGGVFTDAAQSLSLESADGMRSAFISGAYRWKEGYEAAQLSAGFKLRW